MCGVIKHFCAPRRDEHINSRLQPGETKEFDYGDIASDLGTTKEGITKLSQPLDYGSKPDHDNAEGGRRVMNRAVQDFCDAIQELPLAEIPTLGMRPRCRGSVT
jgi:hypothetical protein